jgi:hypothetical protein
MERTIVATTTTVIVETKGSLDSSSTMTVKTRSTRDRGGRTNP